jgi:hypothetical protein
MNMEVGEILIETTGRISFVNSDIIISFSMRQSNDSNIAFPSLSCGKHVGLNLWIFEG